MKLKVKTIIHYSEKDSTEIDFDVDNIIGTQTGFTDDSEWITIWYLEKS